MPSFQRHAGGKSWGVWMLAFAEAAGDRQTQPPLRYLGDVSVVPLSTHYGDTTPSGPWGGYVMTVPIAHTRILRTREMEWPQVTWLPGLGLSPLCYGSGSPHFIGSVCTGFPLVASMSPGPLIVFSPLNPPNPSH